MNLINFNTSNPNKSHFESHSESINSHSKSHLQRPHSENPIPKIPSIFELNPPVGSSQLDLDRWFSSISINWWYLIPSGFPMVFLWFSYWKTQKTTTEFENRATKIKASPPAPASELRTQQIWRQRFHRMFLGVCGDFMGFHGDFMEIYDDLVIWFYYLPWFPAQTSDLEWLEMWKKQIWFLRLKYIWDFHSYKMNWNLWLNENRFKYCKIPGFIQISVLSGASTPSGIKFVPWFCGKITSLKGGTIFRFS